MSLRAAAGGVLALGVLTAAGQTAHSGAVFTAASANPRTAAQAVADWKAPTVAVTDPGSAIRGTVTISATADDGAGSGIASVRLQRAVSGSSTWVDLCTDTTAPYSCSLVTTTLPDGGAIDLRAIATDRTGQTTTSALVEDVEIDNTAPAVALANPGSPLAGTVTLTATADDGDGSGVTEVRIQRAPAGTTAWADACVAAAEPWSCRWNTTAVADGPYDLRAIAVDGAGNTRVSTTVAGRQVANALVSTVSLEDPGDVLRGTVDLRADANSTAGVTSVRIERRLGTSGAWVAVCTDTTSPYTCAFDTTAVANGSYDLRAVMTTGLATTVVSAIVTGRIVDNTPVRGADVQAVNAATAGRLGAGDKLVLTWTRAMNPATLLPGWTGAAPVATTVRLDDGGTLDALVLGGNLGTVALKADRIRRNRTVTFAATAALATTAAGVSEVTVTLGSVTSGSGLRTKSTPATMAWTPSASAKDVTGVASSAVAVSETGPLDLDF